MLKLYSKINVIALKKSHNHCFLEFPFRLLDADTNYAGIYIVLQHLLLQYQVFIL